MRLFAPKSIVGVMSRTCLSLVLLIGSLVNLPDANAADLRECRIPPSEWNIVSLGFPLRKERLANFNSPKILVLPFQLKGESAREITQTEKAIFLSVAQDVKDFSSNINSPEIVINKPIEIPWTSSELDEIKVNVPNTWGKDFSNSTYGFVEKVVKFADSTIDFRGIDAVLLYGKSSSAKQEIAEAMMFTSESMRTNNSKRADGAGWFDPIKTDEGLISNFSLLYNRAEREVITHELMHLYGLTDLYGSETGPGRLSLMSNNTMSLLSYEKWILGWLPNSNVQCLTNVSPNTIHKISLDNINEYQVIVIRSSDREDYVVETTKLNGKRFLAFYSVNNDLRPPLTLFQERRNGQSGGVEINDLSFVGSQLVAPKFTLLVSGIDSSSITLHLAPDSLVSTNEFRDLVSKSTEAKAAADKAAADKAAADKAAADKAAADKAAAVKAAATKLDSQRKITITCVRGKVTKKITAVNPKCPAGYKKK